MPITFHDTDDIEHLGAAAFLHVTPLAEHGSQRFGALLFINARGEPLEFAYNRIELMESALWRSHDREQAAARRLALSLFEAVTLAPTLLLCRAEEIGPHLFGPRGGVTLSIPVLRIATGCIPVGYHSAEAQATVEAVDQHGEIHDAHLFWVPEPPAGPAAALFTRLGERGLLLEPFARAEEGLRTVFGDPPDARP